MVESVFPDLVNQPGHIADSLRYVAEDRSHLLLALEIFLPGIPEAVGIVNVLGGVEADQTVVSFGILGVYEMHVVGGNDLHIVFFGKFPDAFYYLLLFRENRSVGFRIVGLVSLDFKVEVLAEQPDVLLQNLLCRSHRSVEYLIRDLPGQACRRCNKTRCNEISNGNAKFKTEIRI